MSGGGQPMSPAVQRQMEDTFGVDFSEVRLHRGRQANEANNAMSARAMTYGSDIFFADGEYQPASARGKHLLAHELTHVVQQSPGLKRKVRRKSKPAPALKTAKRLQRTLVFGPEDRFPSGSLIHKYVLPRIVKINSDVFIEARIPGANKKGVDGSKTGYADFYRGKDGEEDRLIAIRMDEGTPVFMDTKAFEYVPSNVSPPASVRETFR